MAKDGWEKLVNLENLHELRAACDTKGVMNTELLAYLAIAGLRMFLDTAIEELENEQRKRDAVAGNRKGKQPDYRPAPDPTRPPWDTGY